MSDITERAEAFMLIDQRVNKFVGCYAIIHDLVAEVKQLRRRVRELDLTITEEVSHLSADERAELDNLRSADR
jgi:hypothetical protein